MPQSAWSEKRERQYEHVKDGLEERGRPEKVAKEIAARTVNKERARSGEAEHGSRVSTHDLSSGEEAVCGRIVVRAAELETNSTKKPNAATSGDDRRCRSRNWSPP